MQLAHLNMCKHGKEPRGVRMWGVACMGTTLHREAIVARLTILLSQHAVETRPTRCCTLASSPNTFATARCSRCMTLIDVCVSVILSPSRAYSHRGMWSHACSTRWVDAMPWGALRLREPRRKTIHNILDRLYSHIYVICIQQGPVTS